MHLGEMIEGCNYSQPFDIFTVEEILFEKNHILRYTFSENVEEYESIPQDFVWISSFYSKKMAQCCDVAKL